MSKTAIVRARVSPEVKAEAEAVLQEIGLSISDAINLLLHRIKATHGFPLELKIPNAETLAAFRDVDERRDLAEFATVDELFADAGIVQ
jgi:DNA-damage-inducible protein J